MNSDGLQPGIYFDMPPSIYHADTALSRSNIVALNDTPFSYWEQSWMNPHRKPQVMSEEMEFGDAFHCLMFDPRQFDKRFFVFPLDKWDYNRRMITKENYDKITSAIKVLKEGKDSSLFLSGGQAEVTIVFDAYGVRFRVRIDYLTPVAVVDFKTIYSLHEGTIKKHFDLFGYDVQMFLYKLAVRTFKEQFGRGEAHVYGDVDEKWFDAFMRSEMCDFLFIFQRKSAPYPYEPLFPEDDTEKRGEDKVLNAIEVWKYNWQKYGQRPWEVSNGRVKRFSMQYGIIKEN